MSNGFFLKTRLGVLTYSALPEKPPYWLTIPTTSLKLTNWQKNTRSTRLEKYAKNTGFLDNYERRWLLDFFPAKKKYIYIDQSLRQVVVLESDVSYVAGELPSNFNFTYK